MENEAASTESTNPQCSRSRSSGMKRKAAVGSVIILGLASVLICAIFGIAVNNNNEGQTAHRAHRQLSLASSGSTSTSTYGIGSDKNSYSFNNLRKSYNAYKSSASSSLSNLVSSGVPSLDSLSLSQIHNKLVDDPNDYVYLIIHYHKTGHDLSRSLRDFIAAGFPSGPQSNDRENGFASRHHNEVTKCPTIHLFPGTIVAQAAPNLFCDASVLAELLLNRRDESRPKKGVKIIHLVRSPFSLAVSNFNYHAQYPTPESWVKFVDPCDDERFYDQTYADLTLPALLSPGTYLGQPPIMTHADFQDLSRICKSLYQTKPGFEQSSLYQHMRHLPTTEAIQLSTLHMMTQGVTGGDIIRMANNIIKLKQVTTLLAQMNALHHIPVGMEKVQVLTLSMDEFITHPKENAAKFLDFAFGTTMPASTKEGIVRTYVQDYLSKMDAVGSGGGVPPGVNGKNVDLKSATAAHLTHDMNSNRGEMMEYLRKHEVFGRVLGNINGLVEGALRG